MELERLASVVRPRRSWEAIDLGFRLVQAWWWPVTRAWLVFALPAFVVLNLLFWNAPSWAPVAFWWLKPLFERAPLEVLAQAQFGHIPSLRDILRQWRPALFRQILPTLTVRRFSLSRSFKTPVLWLEGLSGDARRARLAVLSHGRSRGSAQWFTNACANIEGILYLAALAALALLLPADLEIDWWTILSGDNPWLVRGSVAVNFIATALVAPFYVGGGFALYLNQRTELEGWDIELTFRRLKQRLAQGTTAVVLSLALVLAGPAPEAFAAEPATPPAPAAAKTFAERRQAALDKAYPPSEAQKAARAGIKAVLEGADYHKMENFGHWKLRTPPKPGTPPPTPKLGKLDWLSTLGNFIAAAFEFLLWTLLVLLILYIAHRYPAWSRFLPRNRRLRAPDAAPEHVAGLDVRPESLPEDIAGTALELARRGDARAALGLLYRASIAQLLHAHGLPLRASHTEGEILALTALERPEAGFLAYFARLTRAWQAQAYGHHTPDDVAGLCRDWRTAFSAEAAP